MEVVRGLAVVVVVKIPLAVVQCFGVLVGLQVRGCKVAESGVGG